MGHAVLTDVGNGFVGNIPAVQGYLPLQGPHIACYDGNQFALPIALHAGNPHDFPFVHLKADA